MIISNNFFFILIEQVLIIEHNKKRDQILVSRLISFALHENDVVYTVRIVKKNVSRSQIVRLAKGSDWSTGVNYGDTQRTIFV